MKKLRQSIILITGSTDGLGRRVAEDLAGEGAILLLHGRNPEKGHDVRTKIQRATGNQNIFYYNADLASLAEVRHLAATISGRHPSLDTLINNAGLGAGPNREQRQTSQDGFELRFAVNYLAPYLLTQLLLPPLRRAARTRGISRVVNVASSCQIPLDFDNLMLERDYDGMRAYCQSKLALVMFTFDLARELAGSGITVNALHPASLMNTKLVREWPKVPRHTVRKGARAVKKLVLSRETPQMTGQFFVGLNRVTARTQAYDEKARLLLRILSDQWTGITEPESASLRS